MTRPAAAAANSADRHYPFLEGAFTPVTEELTAFDLPVTGRVPHELNGRFLRNGPNVLGLEDPRAHHWMQGEGMVHGVRLRDGRAEWYRNRWGVRSAAVAQKLGEPYPGAAPADDFACNTHVIGHPGRILALQESGPLPYALDRDLGTLGALPKDAAAGEAVFVPGTREAGGRRLRDRLRPQSRPRRRRPADPRRAGLHRGAAGPGPPAGAGAAGVPREPGSGRMTSRDARSW